MSKKRDLQARIEQLKKSTQPGDAKNKVVADAYDALGRRMMDMLNSADPEKDYLSALRTVVAVENLRRIRDEIDRPTNSQLLVLAMAAARDGYRQGLRAITATGAQRKGNTRWPEPVVLFEPMATPMTLNRGGTAGLSFTGEKAKAIPFPLVFIPEYPQSSVGSLCVIQHEIGHNLDEDFQLTESILPLFEDRLQQHATTNKEPGFKQSDIDTWVGWTTELIADTLGVLLAGQALGVELAEWANVLGDDVALASESHPYPTVRVELVAQLMQRFGVSDPIEQPESTATESQVEKFIKQLPIVVDALVSTPIPQLNHMELRDLAVGFASDHQLVFQAAKDLATPTVLGIPQRVPARLLPSVAKLAALQNQATHDSFDQLVDIVRKRGDDLAIQFRRADFVQEAIEDIKPPILDEEHDGLKRPPVDLFRKAKRIAFVGASNDSLPGLFEAYAKDVERNHKDAIRKQQIDIFFITETELSSLSHDGRTVNEMVEGRQESITGLTPELLNRVAERWQIFEHDEPYFFASYWDAESPGGRIHISSHGWGQDIKYAPSVDHIWPSSSARPNRKYRWYRCALSQLYQRASLLSRSTTQ